MAGEAIIVPIILDPKQGLAALKQIGEEGKKANQQFSGAASGQNKFSDSMKKTAGNALQLFGAMNLVQGVTKIFVESVIQAIKGNDRLASSAKLLAEAQRKGAESTKDEVIQLQTLFAVANDASLTYTKRQAAIDKLNKSYPELHKNISLENIGTRETALAIQSVINNLVKKAQLQEVIGTIASLSNQLEVARRVYASLGNTPLGNQVKGQIADFENRIKSLTNEAVNLQAATIGNSAGIGTVFGGKGGEIKVPKVTLKPDKIDIKKPATLAQLLDSLQLKKSPLLLSVPPEEAAAEATEFGAMFYQELQNYFNTATPIDFSLLNAEENYQDKIRNEKELLDLQMQRADQISSYLTPAFTDMFDAVLSKQDALKAFFNAIGQSIKQLIRQLIQAAIQAAVLSLVTGGGAKGGFTFAGAFKKVFGFADGGLVTSPVSALIGEGRTTNANNPEVVAPLDKLKRFFMNISGNNGNYTASGKMGVAGAFMNVPKSVVLYGDGRTLRGVLALEELSQGKNG